MFDIKSSSLTWDNIKNIFKTIHMDTMYRIIVANPLIKKYTYNIILFV